MKIQMRFFCLLALCVVASIAGLEKVDGTGECGRIPADKMAFMLAPCSSAAENAQAPVSAQCCMAVQRLGRNPKCLCAVLLSNTAKRAQIKPQVAMTIPKRCRLAHRPVGYKCGGYTLPELLE